MASGKVAIITGGASGIGYAFAELFLQDGGRVVLGDVLRDEGLKAEAHFNKTFGHGKQVALFVVCDVTSVAQQEAMFEAAVRTFGAVDVVFNNAGIGGDTGQVHSQSAEGDLDLRWVKVVDINLTAVMVGTQLAIRYMRRSGKGGVVINTASAGGLEPMPMSPVYAATKAGVIHFGRSLDGLRAEGIRVCSLCPSFTETGMMKEFPADMRPLLVKMSGGIMTPSYVAKGAMHLVRDAHQAEAVMRVTMRGGLDYWTPRKTIHVVPAAKM